MRWEPFSIHFKQVYDGGHRYLDRCGELMFRAEERLKLMPEEVKPSGCKMSLPESGFTVLMDSSELAVVQEFQRDDGTEFVNLCQTLADMVAELFQPRHVESNGFASKSYWAFGTSDGAMVASLKLGKGLPAELARTVDMPARQENIDCHFESGSMDLHVQVHPVTFQSMTVQRYTPAPRATGAHKRRLERLNRKADRLNTTLQQGLLMDVDLIEFNPPAGPLAKHFKALTTKEAALQARFVVS